MAELRQAAIDIILLSMEHNGEQAEILDEIATATDADIIQFLVDNDYFN